jgi:hypothetical protein
VVPPRLQRGVGDLWVAGAPHRRRHEVAQRPRQQQPRRRHLLQPQPRLADEAARRQALRLHARAGCLDALALARAARAVVDRERLRAPLVGAGARALAEDDPRVARRSHPQAVAQLEGDRRRRAAAREVDAGLGAAGLGLGGFGGGSGRVQGGGQLPRRAGCASLACTTGAPWPIKPRLPIPFPAPCQPTRVRLFSVSPKTSVMSTSTAPLVDVAACGSAACGLRCARGVRGGGAFSNPPRGGSLFALACGASSHAQTWPLRRRRARSPPRTSRLPPPHREELLQLRIQQRRQHLARVRRGVLAVGAVAVEHAEQVGAGLVPVVADLGVGGGGRRAGGGGGGGGGGRGGAGGGRARALGDEGENGPPGAAAAKLVRHPRRSSRPLAGKFTRLDEELVLVFPLEGPKADVLQARSLLLGVRRAGAASAGGAGAQPRPPRARRRRLVRRGRCSSRAEPTALPPPARPPPPLGTHPRADD